MYEMFFISTFKRFVKLLQMTMVMNGYDRNLTTFHLRWTKDGLPPIL